MTTSCAACDRLGPHAADRPRLRVLAVEDEVPILEELVYLLRADSHVSSVEGVSDPTATLRFLHRSLDSDNPVDVVFLDIRMPRLSGLDIAHVLTRFAEPPPIVFVTAFENHAVEAFELHAVDYLLKPVRPERLAETLHRVVNVVHDHTPARPAVPEREPEPTPPGDDDVIPVETGGLTRFVRLADVRYAEAQGDYARLDTQAGSYLVRTPLTALEERWADRGFVRIHRSHLVALRHVAELRSVGGRLTVMIGATALTVSRRHTRRLRDLLVRHPKLNVTGG